ncbi:MAG: hypothetical protein IJU68_07410, partial [Bacteroidales bacterium]|nr:hypothetical protein [Bacteroidales bacterium]
EIVIKELSKDNSILGPSILVYICNETGKNITVQSRNVSVNGFMINSIFSCDIVNGKHALDTISFINCI